MNEKTRQEIEKEQSEKREIEFENKLLSYLLPIVGGLAFLFGILGFVLTLNSGPVGITVFFVILFILGLFSAFCGVVMLIRKKNPNFLKFKKDNEEDTILTD